VGAAVAAVPVRRRRVWLPQAWPPLVWLEQALARVKQVPVQPLVCPERAQVPPLSAALPVERRPPGVGPPEGSRPAASQPSAPLKQTPARRAMFLERPPARG
jgi:hypothetical protein